MAAQAQGRRQLRPTCKTIRQLGQLDHSELLYGSLAYPSSSFKAPPPHEARPVDGMTPSCGSLQCPGHIPPKLLAPGPSFAPDAFAPNARCKLLRSLHLYKGLHAHGTCDFWCSKPRYGHEAMQWSCSGLSKRPSCTESRAVLMLALLQNAADRVHMALAVITPPQYPITRSYLYRSCPVDTSYRSLYFTSAHLSLSRLCNHSESNSRCTGQAFVHPRTACRTGLARVEN